MITYARSPAPGNAAVMRIYSNGLSVMTEATMMSNDAMSAMGFASSRTDVFTVVLLTKSAPRSKIVNQQAGIQTNERGDLGLSRGDKPS